MENWFKRFAASPPAIPTPGAPALVPPPGGGTGAQRVVINGAFVDGQVRTMLVDPITSASLPPGVEELLSAGQSDPASAALIGQIQQGNLSSIKGAVELLSRRAQGDKSVPIPQRLAAQLSDPGFRSLVDGIMKGKFGDLDSLEEFFSRGDNVTKLLVELSKGSGKVRQLMDRMKEYDQDISIMVQSGTEDGVRYLEQWYGNLLSAFPELVNNLNVPGSFRQIPGSTSSGKSNA